MSEELKPCECGCTPRREHGKTMVQSYRDYETGEYLIMCEECRKETAQFRLLEDAIAAWNKDTPPSPT